MSKKIALCCHKMLEFLVLLTYTHIRQIVKEKDVEKFSEG